MALKDAVVAHMKVKDDFRARLLHDPEAIALFNMIYAGFLATNSTGRVEAAVSAAAEIDRALIAPKAAEVARLRALTAAAGVEPARRLQQGREVRPDGEGAQASRDEVDAAGSDPEGGQPEQDSGKQDEE